MRTSIAGHTTPPEEAPALDARRLREGLQYAERNLLSADSHLYLDKDVLKKHFDLKGKDVLDFGCGMGTTSLWLAREMEAKVDGFDLDPNHIAVARELNLKFQVARVNFEVRNIIESPVDKQYDFIVLNDVIEHIRIEWIPKILDILIGRNLKKGGIIFFSYPPWEGPHASHLHRSIKIPWIQFFPQRYVYTLIRQNNKQLVGSKDLLSEYRELNHMTHKKLMVYLRPFGLQQVFRCSHTKLNRLSLLKNVSLNFFPFNYIITKELIAFRKG
ncbi:MAG: methyltransferase domain-containing protein [Cyclobacteriaceae bacterium]